MARRLLFRDPVTRRPISYETATVRVQQYAAARRHAARSLAHAREQQRSARTIRHWEARRAYWSRVVRDLAGQRRTHIADELERVRRREMARRTAVRESQPAGVSARWFFGGAYRAQTRGGSVAFEVHVESEIPLSGDAARGALSHWLRTGEELHGTSVVALDWSHGRRRQSSTDIDEDRVVMLHLLRAVRWTPVRQGAIKTFR